MKALFAAVLLLGSSALADVMPEEVASCRDKALGAACTTPDGLAGRCVEMTFSRPDYSQGIPPGTKQVKMVGCAATAQGSARSVLPWVGVGLAFLAMVAALKTRRLSAA